MLIHCRVNILDVNLLFQPSRKTIRIYIWCNAPSALQCMLSLHHQSKCKTKLLFLYALPLTCGRLLLHYNFPLQNKILAVLQQYVQNKMLESLHCTHICQLFTHSTKVEYNTKVQIKQTHIPTALLWKFLQAFNRRRFPHCCFRHSIGGILDLLCYHAHMA